MALTSGNKVNNNGQTPQGKLTAEEYNALVGQCNQNEADIDSLEQSVIKSISFQGTPYTPVNGNVSLDLPLATPSSFGCVKIGQGLKVVNGLLSINLASSDIASLTFSWNQISSDKPTDLAGYGITDAKIVNGTITLGSESITPITSHQSLYKLSFISGSFSTKTYDPVSAALTVKIPTTTSHISEGSNLYFTDARAVSALKTTTDNLSSRLTTLEGANYLTSITKSMVEAVLTGDITSHTHNQCLTDLLDTAIDNPSSGQTLIYNGTKWVNQAIQTGLDEAALASYLTTHSYATQQWVESKGYLTAHQSLANYVTLDSAQNITGAKTFSANVTFQQPVNTYGFRLRFLENAEFQGGFIGYDGANNIFSIGVHEVYDTNLSNDLNAISILRSNAYVGIGTPSPTQKLHVNGSVLATQFIKSGGTASQFLMADGSVATKHVLTASNNLGWNGTQGQIPTIDTLAFWNGRYNASNSNLQYCDRGRFGTMATATASDYLARAGGSMLNTTLVTNLNADLLDGYQETAYFRSNIGSIAVADIMTKLPGNRSGSYQITQSGWNGSAVVLYAGGSNSGLAFYRPGGSNSIPKILVAVDSSSAWTDKGTIVTTSEGNAPSATKLATARTIWGQSFNGTANVSGSLTGVSSIGFNGNYEFGIHNGRYVFGTTGQVGAVGANVGSLLVSNMWADATKVPTNGIYVKGDLRIGDITLSYDAANGGLHVSGGGLYADSYISGRGVNTSGSGSSGGGLIQQVYGSSSLGGVFSDTTLTDTFNAYTINKMRTDLMSADNALSGRITSLEGGAAVSVTTTGSGNAITAISKSGTTITATKGTTFLTAHQSLANYVTLNTTQTITGLKTFTAASTTAIFNSTGTTATNVVLKTNGTQRSSIGWYSNFVFISNEPNYTGASTDKYHRLGITDDGVPQYWTNRDGSKYTLLHEGNYTSILDSRYVNVTGDTMTGLLSVTRAGNFVGDFDEGIRVHACGQHNWAAVVLCGADNTGDAGTSANTWGMFAHDGAFGIGRNGNGITSGTARLWCDTNNVWRVNGTNVLLHGGNYSSVLDSRYYTESEADARFVNVTGDTMTGLLAAKVGSSHSGIKLGNTYLTAINGDTILQNNNAIRFGTDAWDYNQWAGLKYSHTDKTVYLGLADGSIFTANAAQSGGKILTPGISNIYVGNNTTNKVWHAGNDGAGSGLDADYLDGYHESAFLRQGVGRLSTTAAFDIRRTCTNELYNYNPYSFDEEYGTIVTFSSGGVNFAGQFYLPRLGGSHISYRGKNDTNNTWSAWSKLAFLTDNVASATKLQTSRSLWGQSFNGTANVDGALTVHHTGACGVYISGGGESSYSCQASGGLRWVSGAYPDRYFIWDSSGNGNERLTILNNGSVGIGTTSPSAKLDVIGVIHSTAGMWSNGYVSARGQNTASDARLKAIMQTKLLDTRSIAAAPSVLFRWKDDGREDVGSIAQYWQRIDRHLVSHRPDGYLGLDYGKAALLSVISVAKSTLNHEERIKALEKENALLKKQIKSLT